MVESYHEFTQEKHNYEKTLEILANKIIKEREKLWKLKKEIALSRKSLNRIKNERKKIDKSK